MRLFGIGISFSACRRKVRYRSKDKALVAIGAMAKKGRIGLTEYPCAFCFGWHIGHYFSQKITIGMELSKGDVKARRRVT